ncbi:hypothetical protein HPULCUR_004782 [Helicostylum pulchrum]|uniref:Uncharacterized protein n=1 Tax=Helicostylum pulchrum TaxID=562976 RepID=A0ABP9XY51_9FUNG
MTYVVPVTAKETFELLVDYEELSNFSISIKPIAKLDIGPSVVYTQEYFERYVQALKDDAKLHMYFTDRSSVKYKNNLSDLLPLYRNQLFKAMYYEFYKA